MLAINKKNFPCNSASLKDFYLLCFPWSLKGSLKFCLNFFFFSSDSFFWEALDQYRTHAFPWRLYNGTWYPAVMECRSQQPFSCRVLLLLLFPSEDTIIQSCFFLLGLCFSESAKLINWDAPLTLPFWLTAAILLKRYWRHRPMDESSININSFSLRVRLKCFCNHKNVAKLLYRLTKMK